MDELFTIRPSGIFLRREALRYGYDDRSLLHARRAGLITRIRQGAYISRFLWDGQDDEGKHLLRCEAVLLTHGDRVALSHTSGALAHGMRLYDQDLTRVHVTRLDGNRGARAADVVYHELNSSVASAERTDGRLLLDPTSCALGAASTTSLEGAVCVLDSYLHLELGSPTELMAAYLRREHWPHSQHLRMAVGLARRGGESVAESRMRFLFWCHHIPEPELQFEVHDHRGRLIGTTDFAWPDRRVFGEMDGKGKYGRLRRPDQTPEDVVFEEKKREDAIRFATQFRMIRYVYGDLYVPVRTIERTRLILGLPLVA